ncbi:MAG: STAS domain-containing protein [Terriglobia bacterium]
MATESATIEDLSIQVTHSGREAVISLSGRVTIDSSPGLRKELHALLGQQSPPTLIVDLSELSYIDCSGIATLVEALRIARQSDTKLQLRGLRDGPRHLLEVTGLLHLFDTNGEMGHLPLSTVH